MPHPDQVANHTRETSAERDRRLVEFPPPVGSVHESHRERDPADGPDRAQADQERGERGDEEREVEHGGSSDALARLCLTRGTPP